jgi:hypothetical protein
MSLPLLRRRVEVQAVQMDGMVSQNPWQDHGYRNVGSMGELEGVEDQGYDSCLRWLQMLRW